MSLESFTEFARNLFIRTMTGCEIPEALSVKVLATEFSPLVTTVARCAQSLGLMIVKDSNTLFLRQGKAILESEEKAATFALSVCLKLNENVGIENFALTCGFLSEFVSFRFNKKPCYRIVHIASECLLSLYRRLYYDHFQQKGGFGELWSYCDHVKELVEAVEGRGGNTSHAFGRDDRHKIRNLVRSCDSFNPEELEFSEVEITNFDFIESKSPEAEKASSSSSAEESAAKESESSSSPESMIVQESESSNSSDCMIVPDSESSDSPVTEDMNSPESESSGSPVAEYINIPESGSSSSSVAEDMNIPQSESTSSENMASSESNGSSDSSPPSLSPPSQVLDTDSHRQCEVSDHTMQASAGTRESCDRVYTRTPGAPETSATSDSEMPGVAGPSTASGYELPGVPGPSRTTSAAEADDVFRGDDFHIYFKKFYKSKGGYICGYCLSNCTKYLRNL